MCNDIQCDEQGKSWNLLAKTDIEMSEATRNAVEVLTYKVQIFARLAMAMILQSVVKGI